MTPGDVASWVAIAASVALGGWGLRQSSRANTHSAQALELARSAEARADRLEAMQTESRDIEWTCEWVASANTISVRNVGTDPAHDVVLTVDIKATARQTVEQTSIGPGDAIGYRPTYSIQQDATVEAWAENRERAGIPASVRVTWRSANGVPDAKTWPELTLWFQ